MIVHLPTLLNHGNGAFRTITDSINLRIQDATDERVALAYADQGLYMRKVGRGRMGIGNCP